MSSNPLLNLLVAYPYFGPGIGNLIAERSSEIRLLVDSGAFTAWKAKKKIELDDYCRFIEALPLKPWAYFSLDVVGNPHATLENYNTMLKRGFKPVPVFTRGEDISVLEEYYRTSDYVAIGGLVGTLRNKGFVKGIMRVVGSRKVHWLGFTNLNFMKKYRPYSADSSTWEMGARFASCPIYIKKGAKVLSIRKPMVLEQMRNPVIRRAVVAYGFNPDDFFVPENWNGGLSITRRLGAKTMCHLSRDVFSNLGTNLFLAATTDYAIRLLLEANKT